MRAGGQFPNPTSFPWGKRRKVQGMFSGAGGWRGVVLMHLQRQVNTWSLYCEHNWLLFVNSSSVVMCVLYHSSTKMVRCPLPLDPYIAHCWSINSCQNSQENIAWDEMLTKSPFTSSGNAWRFLMGHKLLRWWSQRSIWSWNNTAMKVLWS